MKDVERSRREDQVNDKKKEKRKKEKKKGKKQDIIYRGETGLTASLAGSTPYVTSVPLQGKCPMPPNNTA